MFLDGGFERRLRHSVELSVEFGGVVKGKADGDWRLNFLANNADNHTETQLFISDPTEP